MVNPSFPGSEGVQEREVEVLMSNSGPQPGAHRFQGTAGLETEVIRSEAGQNLMGCSR